MLLVRARLGRAEYYHRGRQLQGPRAISHHPDCHHDSDELDMLDTEGNQQWDSGCICVAFACDCAVVEAPVYSLKFDEMAGMVLSGWSTWASPPEAEVLYYHDKDQRKPGREAGSYQLRLTEAVWTLRVYWSRLWEVVEMNSWRAEYADGVPSIPWS